MSSWEQTARRIGHRLERSFDRLRYDLWRRLDYDRPLQIVAYRSYGTTASLIVHGRVLACRNGGDGGGDGGDDESLWQNLLAAYRRFESDEVPDTRIDAVYRGLQTRTRSDDEGYFRLSVAPPPSAAPAPAPPPALWHGVALSAPERAGPDGAVPRALADVMIPPADSRFGVISDIDDTVLITGATSLLTMARLTFLRSPRSRLPFAGVAAFYRALTEAGDVINPLFYVSSSPWNLYDFLCEFMDRNGIPCGPLLLRDFGLDDDRFIQSGHAEHKRTQIDRILYTYPRLPFILIGDSGQHDPEIYADIIDAYPQRIAAVYIRDVSADPARNDAVSALRRRARARGVDLLLVADTVAAAEHAAAAGLIRADALEPIRAERRKDAAAPGPFERALLETG